MLYVDFPGPESTHRLAEFRADSSHDSCQFGSSRTTSKADR